MRLFTFAISSIVDANTGYGLSGTKKFLEVESAAKPGSAIQSKSAHGLFASIKSLVARGIESYQARAQERRDLAKLLGMNDRLLKDIGLNRGDLIAVELGSISLRELHAERHARHDRGHEIVNTAQLGGTTDIEHEAANEASYQGQKCA